jgi:large subunit ribosomal protein L7Ae
MTEQAYEAVEIARTSGEIKKGTNEATKSIERDEAALVVVADDVSPDEITLHLEPLCDEQGIPCVTVDSKVELGAAAGLPVASAAVAITEEGDAADKIKALAT